MAEQSLERSVRHPVWQGVQEIAGLWFPADWLAPEARVARMLAVWQPGCRAYRFEMGDVLRFAQPQSLVCEHAPGLALCSIRGGLYSAPLTTQELAALPAADVGVVAGGQVHGLRFDQAAPLDLSEAIDIGGYALHDTYDCRVSQVALKLPRLEGKNVRSLLGEAIPPQSRESEAFLQRLKGGRDAMINGDGRSPLARGASLVKDGILGLGFAALFKLVPAIATTSPTGNGGLRPREHAAKPQWWREKLARLAVASRVGKLIGHRQGAYLRRMMDMFEKGDLDEALRNALPLDSLGQSLGQAFGAPQRRSSLQVSGRIGSATNINLGHDLQQHLRQLYRASFEKLDRQGRIDEALFVLAELLNARQEAIDYLARHGRHAQAAELALGWDMPVGMIIRLLMLAGDSTRAVLVARRDGAFSEAIQQLQPSHPALADALRLEWGHALVDGGDWLGAVDAVWPLANAREQAMQWLLSAEQAGEALSARALVQRAVLLPDTVEHYATGIEVLADPALHADARTAMAEALIASKGNTAALRALATSMLPAVAADRAAGRNDLSAADLDRLLKLSGDPFLKADVPTWVSKAAAIDVWKRSTPLLMQAPAAGLHRIHDAAVLPDRRYLVALGEAGAAVLDAQGRVKQRYAVPAFKLVLADSGQVALAVAPRERVSRIARLDLVNHAIVDLGVMALQFAAPGYDGIGWTVVADDRILVIDTSKPSRDVLWHVGDLPGPIVAAGFFSHCEIYLVRGQDDVQDWSYSLPGRRLQARSELRLLDDLPVVVHPMGRALQPQVRVIAGSHVEVCYRWGNFERKCVLGEGVPDGEFHCTFIAVAAGLVVGLHQATGSRYFIIRVVDGVNVAVIEWPPGSLARVREHSEHLLFHDDAGRLLDLAVDTSTTRHISVL